MSKIVLIECNICRQIIGPADPGASRCRGIAFLFHEGEGTNVLSLSLTIADLYDPEARAHFCEKCGNQVHKLFREFDTLPALGA